MGRSNIRRANNPQGHCYSSHSSRFGKSWERVQEVTHVSKGGRQGSQLTSEGHRAQFIKSWICEPSSQPFCYEWRFLKHMYIVLQNPDLEEKKALNVLVILVRRDHDIVWHGTRPRSFIIVCGSKSLAFSKACQNTQLLISAIRVTVLLVQWAAISSGNLLYKKHFANTIKPRVSVGL